MKRHIRRLPVFGMTMAALTLAVAGEPAWAVEFPEAELFFELNAVAARPAESPNISGIY